MLTTEVDKVFKAIDMTWLYVSTLYLNRRTPTT